MKELEELKSVIELAERYKNENGCFCHTMYFKDSLANGRGTYTNFAKFPPTLSPNDINIIKRRTWNILNSMKHAF